MKFIYHIHDKICGHATNTLEQVVQIALNHQYNELFYTEHCPLDDNNLIFRPTGDEIKDLRLRIDAINKKYTNKLKIHFGLEAEFSKGDTAYFENLKNNSYVDYLIFGNHYLGDMGKHPRLVMDCAKTKKDLDEYLKNAKLALQSKIFSLFAHPDVGLSAYQKGDVFAQKLTKALIKLCEQNQMPMGFNANGLFATRNEFNYPSPYFWKEVSKSKVKVVVEADAHTPLALDSNGLKKATDKAIEFGLKKNLVEQIAIHYFHL